MDIILSNSRRGDTRESFASALCVWSMWGREFFFLRGGKLWDGFGLGGVRGGVGVIGFGERWGLLIFRGVSSGKIFPVSYLCGFFGF